MGAATLPERVTRPGARQRRPRLRAPADPRVGTLKVPPAAAVAVGVPVDATVGTGVVKLADVAAVTGAQIAAATNADT